MATLGQIYQDYLDTPYYERVSLGRKEVNIIKRSLRDALGSNVGDGDLNFIIVMLCRGFIGADGQFDGDEYEYLRDVFGFSVSYDSVLEHLNNLSYDTRIESKELIAGMDRDTKFAVLRFGILICVADGTLTVDEQREVERFLM